MSTALSGSLPVRGDEDLLLPEVSGLALRLYRGGTQALVLHFHGGVFTGGSLDSGAAVARVLAGAGATVASLDYPLAPAHPFPQAVEAGYAALQWLQRQRRRLAGHAPLYVAGEEAGGNLAAAVALMARDRGGPELAGQLLLSPMLDACIGTASQRDARSGLAGCPCAEGWLAYLSRPDDVTHPYAVPARSMRLAGLPPTLLVTAEDDPLRDETRAFAERLRAAEVPVTTSVLQQATGWPRSYRSDGSKPWAAALRQEVRAFFPSTSANKGL